MIESKVHRMSESSDRIKLIRAAIDAVPRVPDGEGHAHDGVAPVKPTPTQINAGFRIARAAINAMITSMVGAWAISHVSDLEVHTISDAVVKAAINSK